MLLLSTTAYQIKCFLFQVTNDLSWLQDLLEGHSTGYIRCDIYFIPEKAPFLHPHFTFFMLFHRIKIYYVRPWESHLAHSTCVSIIQVLLKRSKRKVLDSTKDHCWWYDSVWQSHDYFYMYKKCNFIFWIAKSWTPSSNHQSCKHK